MKTLRIMLLQARRPDDAMGEHELLSFVDHCGLERGQFTVHSLLDGPPPLSATRSCDALMVGGAGEYYVSHGNLPEFDAVLAFFAEVTAAGFPMFASCFGFHCLVVALGGEVVFDPENTELGTYELTLSDAGARDPLFSVLPPTFHAQEGHKDRVVRYPEAIPNLASSVLSPFQALRIPNAPIWATQFHPELTRRTNLDRFERYLDTYAQHMDPAECEAAIARFQESPRTPVLLPKFLEIVFG